MRVRLIFNRTGLDPQNKDAYITDAYLKDVEEIWRDEHPGQEPDKKVIFDIALRTMNAVRLFYRPIPTHDAHKYFEILKHVNGRK